MNLATLITNIKSAWSAAIPATTLYFQLAPEKTSGQFAVFRLGTITPGEEEITNRNWETTLTIGGFAASDTDVLALSQSIVNLFDRGNIIGVYSCTVQSVELDLNYGDQMMPWTVSTTVLIRWTV